MTAEEFKLKFPDCDEYLMVQIENSESVEKAMSACGWVAAAVTKLVSDRLSTLDVANMALVGLVSDGMSTIESQVANVAWLAPLKKERQIASAILALDTTIRLTSNLSKSAYFTGDHIIQSMVVLHLCERGDTEIAQKLIHNHHWACKNSASLIVEALNRK